MKAPTVIMRIALVFILVSAIALAVALRAAPPRKPGPHAKVVALDAGGKGYLQVLGGPPDSVTMKSGLEALAPGQSVGKHSTGQHEELLVILEGKGEMIFKDGSTLPVEANHALYCPPETEHDVSNTGTGILRYVYVVASIKGPE